MGEIKAFGFRRCSRDLIQFYYAPRGRGSFYFGLILSKGLFGFKFYIFAMLGVVWEPNSAFFLYKGLFGFKFSIFAALGAIWEPKSAFLLY